MAQPNIGAGSGAQFSFYVSSDINVQVQVRLLDLIGCIPAYEDADMAPGGIVRPSALYATATLCDKFDILSAPSRTHFAEAGGDGCSWDSWLTFAPKYRDLGPSAQVAITVWEVREGVGGATPLGGTTFRLFSKKGRLKSGRHSLRLWLGREGDTGGYPPATPGKVPVVERGPAGQVERALKRYQRGEYDPVPWLDGLAVNAAEGVLANHAQHAHGTEPLHLTVEVPSFPLPVLYQDVVLPASNPAIAAAEETEDALRSPLPGTSRSGVAVPPSLGPAATARPGGPLLNSSNRIILIQDPEVGKESAAEVKAQKLARSTGRSLVDMQQRPNTEERAKIDAALSAPPGRPLSREERELLWRFRYVLVSDGGALTQFLRCVDWADAEEAQQASDLMKRWAQITVADALELLSPDFSVEAVRTYAVSALQSTSDDELLLYLLQLVQALRYEPEDDSPLASFLLGRAKRSAAVASALYWYLCPELEDPTFGPRAIKVQKLLLGQIPKEHGGSGQAPVHEVHLGCIPAQIMLIARLKHLHGEMQGKGTADRKTEAIRALLAPNGPCADLASFECPCPLDPSVQLAGIVPSGCSVFKSKMSPMRITFKVRLPAELMWSGEGSGGHVTPPGSGHAASPAAFGQSPRQASAELPARLASVTLTSSAEVQGGEGASASAVSGGSPPRRSSIGSGSAPASPAPGSSVGPAPAPMATLSLIYKHGDDLRQDQLVLQMISLMDRLLKQEHLDLRITPYQVLPTSPNAGLIEFVPASLPLSQVLRENSSVHRFLTRHHPDPKGPYGLDPDVLNNYIRSCAGYTVLTFILGIGDRHNDNIMLTTDGRLFHIDFGYFLGRDPKFSIAPLVLNRAMVDVMGGADTPHYRQFVQLCGEAFNILRKSANLLLSLVHLMAGSSIPDIRCDPEAALLKVQERLKLEMNDEEAAAMMEAALAAAQAAMLPRVAEMQHSLAQRWR